MHRHVAFFSFDGEAFSTQRTDAVVVRVAGKRMPKSERRPLFTNNQQQITNNQELLSTTNLTNLHEYRTKN